MPARTPAPPTATKSTGQLRNLPAGTTLHLSELTSSQFVERGTAKTDAQGRFHLQGDAAGGGAVYQLKLDEPNQVLLVLDNKTALTLAGDGQSLPASYSVQGLERLGADAAAHAPP